MTLCALCRRDEAGHEQWNRFCAAWAEHDFAPENLMSLSEKYGLQYRELLRQSTVSVAQARIALADAERELQEAEQSIDSLRNRVTDLRSKFEREFSILEARSKRDPAQAIELYRSDTGHYPLHAEEDL